MMLEKHIIWKLSIIFGYCIVFIHLISKNISPICLYPLYIQMPIAYLFSFNVLATYIFIGGKTNVWWYPPFYVKQTKTYKHKDEPGNSAFLGWLSDPLKGCKCDLPPIGISYRGRGLNHLELVQGYLRSSSVVKFVWVIHHQIYTLEVKAYWNNRNHHFGWLYNQN